MRLPSILDANIPSSSLFVTLEAFLQGERGTLSPALFAGLGTRVASQRFPAVAAFRPLGVKLERLRSGSVYKIVATVEHQGRTLRSHVAFLSTSEGAELVEGEKVEEEEEMGKSPKLAKNGICISEVEVGKEIAEVQNPTKVLEARKARDWQDYIKCGYKFPEAHTDSLREERVTRSLVLGAALDVLGGLADEEDERAIINGGWFMGPLYTHDPHYLKMKSKS